MTAPSPRVELWICRALSARTLLDGLTTAEERRERVRHAILDGGLVNEWALNTRERGLESWAQVFARVYGQPLIPPEVAAA